MTEGDGVIRRVLQAEDDFAALGLPVCIAAPAVVRSAFRRLSLRVHPDKCDHPQSALAFQRIADAFEALHEPSGQQRALREALGEGRVGTPAAKRRRRAARTDGGGGGGGNRRTWEAWEAKLRALESLERRFQSLQSDRFAARRAAHTLAKAERVAAELDERAGIEENALLELSEDRPDEMVEGDPLRLMQLLLYLRREHSY